MKDPRDTIGLRIHIALAYRLDWLRAYRLALDIYVMPRIRTRHPTDPRDRLD